MSPFFQSCFFNNHFLKTFLLQFVKKISNENKTDSSYTLLCVLISYHPIFISFLISSVSFSGRSCSKSPRNFNFFAHKLAAIHGINGVLSVLFVFVFNQTITFHITSSSIKRKVKVSDFPKISKFIVNIIFLS